MHVIAPVTLEKMYTKIKQVHIFISHNVAGPDSLD